MAKKSSPRKPKTTRAAKTKAAPRLPKTIQAVIEAARDRKANDIVVLDLRKAGAFTDFFVICSGANPRQVQAIADEVETRLEKTQGMRVNHMEGYKQADSLTAKALRLSTYACVAPNISTAPIAIATSSSMRLRPR